MKKKDEQNNIDSSSGIGSSPILGIDPDKLNELGELITERLVKMQYLKMLSQMNVIDKGIKSTERSKGLEPLESRLAFANKRIQQLEERMGQYNSLIGEHFQALLNKVAQLEIKINMGAGVMGKEPITEHNYSFTPIEPQHRLDNPVYQIERQAELLNQAMLALKREHDKEIEKILGELYSWADGLEERNADNKTNPSYIIAGLKDKIAGIQKRYGIRK